MGVTLNLYDPLGWFNEDKDKVRGRQVEINNGRLAMLGLFSLLAESKAPGAVPPLRGSFLSTLVTTWSHSKLTSLSGLFPRDTCPRGTITCSRNRFFKTSTHNGRRLNKRNCSYSML